MESMQPAFEDETPINPYDFWEGAEFKIKIRKVEGWVNYDKSEFAKQSALYEGDEERLEEVYGKLHSLQDFLKPENYKTYDELKAKMNKVLGVDAGAPSMDMPAMNVVNETPMTQTATAAPVMDTSASSDDEDDTLSYFAKLANEN
jgi:hypothetical protein